MDKRIDRKVILLGILFLLLFPVKVMAKPLDEIQDEDYPYSNKRG